LGFVVAGLGRWVRSLAVTITPGVARSGTLHSAYHIRELWFKGEILTLLPLLFYYVSFNIVFVNDGAEWLFPASQSHEAQIGMVLVATGFYKSMRPFHATVICSFSIYQRLNRLASGVLEATAQVLPLSLLLAEH
jgi:hypothetical protein